MDIKCFEEILSPLKKCPYPKGANKLVKKKPNGKMQNEEIF
jgi:hypothetical protein